MSKTRIHQLVCKDDCVLEATTSIAIIDQIRDALFVHGLIHGGKRQFLRHDTEKQCATDGCVVKHSLHFGIAVFVLGLFFDPDLHARV